MLTVDELRMLKAQGKTDAEIVAEYDITRYRLRKLRKQHDIEHFGNDTSQRPLRQHLVELKRQGLSDAAIAEKLGCSSSAVHKWRKAYNIPASMKQDDADKRRQRVAEHRCEFVYALGGNVFVLRAPLAVVQAAQRVYERTVA